MKKVGMVLEGGGLRGLYTAGVLDVLMDNNIEVDGIIGVSAGALFGVNFFSKQKGRVIRYNKKYCNDKRYMSMRSLILTGNYINKNFAFYKMSKELDKFDNKEFIKTNKDFYAVITNVETGKPEYIKITSPIDQLEELRASSALPLLSRMVVIDKKKYLDGGISDSIPINKMKELKYKKIIVVETQPKDYRKKPLSDKKQKVVKIRFKKYPNLINTMFNRHNKYNEVKNEISKLEDKKEIFVIRPSSSIDINIKEKNEDKYQYIYDLGVSDAKKVIKKLKNYLK